MAATMFQRLMALASGWVMLMALQPVTTEVAWTKVVNMVHHQHYPPQPRDAARHEARHLMHAPHLRSPPDVVAAAASPSAATMMVPLMVAVLLPKGMTTMVHQQMLMVASTTLLMVAMLLPKGVTTMVH